MVAAIIQARMGSTRLPGKIFKKILTKSMLEHMIERVKRAKTVDKIIIATTTNSEDEKVVRLAKKLGIALYRGSENDVLDRYYQAAKKFRADTIVRVTGDCPFMDPFVIDEVVSFFKKNKFDYVSNTHPPTFPDGMDVEVFSFKALERAWREAKLPSEREHVTPYIIKRPRKFRIANVENTEDLSRLRLTVDEPEDLLMVRKLAKFFSRQNKKDFGLKEIAGLWRKNPGLFKSNQFIKRNEGYQRSLSKDRKNNFANQSVKAMVVLGGGLKKGVDGWRTTNFDEGDNFGSMGDRLRVMAGYLLYKDAKRRESGVVIVASGGKGKLKNVVGAPTVASIIKKELMELGVPEKDILLEDRSNNTFEQLKKIHHLSKRFGSWTIISNEYHLPRIKTIIEHDTGLKKMLSALKIELKSAEEIVMKYNPKKWQKIINLAYRSGAMQGRIALEKRGVQDIKRGKYKTR